MRRFAQSDFQSISAMVEAGGDGASIPKLNDKDVCLVWALKGTCTCNCNRKAQHKPYGRSIVSGIHTLMDQCGVAASN